jgi:hypothetical protein
MIFARTVGVAGQGHLAEVVTGAKGASRLVHGHRRPARHDDAVPACAALTYTARPVSAVSGSALQIPHSAAGGDMSVPG